jgi:alkanesulfonate monooxygenase SsuD/methylene tetrahydromethanopterin reductase-like flavin-dependent oxidoreductase (luciferase family)
METVDYEGQQLHVDDIQLDVLYRDKEPIDVPIYIGATRPTMHKLSGELAAKGVVRGVFKDYLIPPEENLKGMEKLQEGVEKHGGSLSDVDSPQLIAVSMDEDRQTAIDQAKRLVTQYIGEQPPIREASGIDPEKGKLIEEEIGPWPVDQSDVERATKHVDDEIVTNVVAAGTPDEVVSRIRDYCETGCTEPVVYSIGDNVKEVIDVVAEAKSD